MALHRPTHLPLPLLTPAMCAASPPCQGLSWAVRSALEVYGQDPAQFQAIQKRGMERDARCVCGGGGEGGGA